jgi:hypothetical protein
MLKRDEPTGGEGEAGVNGDDGAVPFEAALERALKRRGLRRERVCPPGDALARRLLAEYGAMFVAAESVRVPPVCVFESEEEVRAFQREATSQAAAFGDEQIELQPAALSALLEARDEARREGLELTPRGGAEAARRSFADSLRLWRSRVLPALDYWCAHGALVAGQADDLCALPLREQVEAVLEMEACGIFFSKDFSKSILHSVAAPGASQHLSMLAFDIAQFRDARLRRVLARHGWFQTVLSDLPHFTFLGLEEAALPAHGLKRVVSGEQTFWIPNIEETMNAER